HKVRPQTSITYATGTEHMFGVPKYASALARVASDRGLAVHYNTELVEITPGGAVFLNEHGAPLTLPYNFLHVTPPMSPPTCLSKCEELVTEQGLLDVDKHTLQHRRYRNVYGLGDCVCTPNSKTAAAVSRQSYVVEHNLAATMADRDPLATYDGYGACPVLTSYKAGILAEYLYDKESYVVEHNLAATMADRDPLATYDGYGACPVLTSYKAGILAEDILPYLYWKRLIKGKFNGPSTIRKIINPFKR
ncbi:putative sulfide quinone reductase, partial [Operophtera brumata]